MDFKIDSDSRLNFTCTLGISIVARKEEFNAMCGGVGKLHGCTEDQAAIQLLRDALCVALAGFFPGSVQSTELHFVLDEKRVLFEGPDK